MLEVFKETSVYDFEDDPLFTQLNPSSGQCTNNCAMSSDPKSRYTDNVGDIPVRGIPSYLHVSWEHFVCDCGPGWSYLETPYAGECYDCTQIDPHCSRCAFDGSDYTCTQCGSNNLIAVPVANQPTIGAYCQPKFHGCVEADWSIQPTNLATDGTFGWWDCPTCKDGYYHEAGTATDPPACVKCDHEMDGCSSCSDDSTCLTCAPGYFLKRDNSGCMKAIEYCKTDPSNYETLAGAPYCKECMKGYYPDGEECRPCDNSEDGIADCEACSEGPICHECSGSKLPVGDGSACMDPFDNCLSKPVNYNKNKDDEWYCPKCKTGYTWHDGECTTCATAVPGCDYCDFRGNCLRCEADKFLNYAGTECLDVFDDCLETDPKQYAFSDLYKEYYCEACEDGKAFSFVDWECSDLCSDHWGPFCTICSDEGCHWCDDDHFIPGVRQTGTWCQLKVENCDGLTREDFMASLMKMT